MKILLASYYTPGIRALETLFARGVRPEQIAVLSHVDSRNGALLDYVAMHGIDLCTAAARSDEAFEWAAALSPDVMFSLYYREIFPARMLEVPRFTPVNLHPSLLPRYRGAFSSPWVIFNGEEYTGYTYHQMTEGVDQGDILLQRKIRIRVGETAYSLYHRVIQDAMNAFGEVLDSVLDGSHGVPQDGEPSYYPRAVPFDGIVNPEWDDVTLDRFIRALYFPPFPGATARLDSGREVEIESVEGYRALIGNQDGTTVET